MAKTYNQKNIIIVSKNQNNKNASEEKNIEIFKLKFQAMITEYNAMKTESIEKLKMQITLISLYITALATVLSISLDKSTDNIIILDEKNLFCFVIPCVTICIAAIWLDQVYRQIKIAYFLSLLEEKINKFLESDNNFSSSAMIWEHWLRTDEINTGKINASLTFYYVCLGIFSFVPILSFLYGFNIINFNINLIRMQSIICFAGYFIFILLSAVYVINILKLNNKVKKTKTTNH